MTSKKSFYDGAPAGREARRRLGDPSTGRIPLASPSGEAKGGALPGHFERERGRA
jgi:hypothetical protein